MRKLLEKIEEHKNCNLVAKIYDDGINMYSIDCEDCGVEVVPPEHMEENPDLSKCIYEDDNVIISENKDCYIFQLSGRNYPIAVVSKR